ncbi:MAG TPA: serine hydrolase domain-containing protein, partial [Vicinamibacteria bacterium]|nr:serine hydrolase domain-containing protein [Vicinamibacteria bacterium]
MRCRTASIASAVLAFLAVPAGRAGEASSPLDSLRLLPRVPLKGEVGWSLGERMRHHRVEAVSVALVRDYRVAWEAAAGLADREVGGRATPSTLFQAGSISKPVAAAAVLREAERGTFRLDADVNQYLRSWKVPENELTAREKVTLERILSHGAGFTVHGFPGFAAGEAVPSVPQVLDGVPPANTAPVRVDILPGSRWRYSGGGTTVAQLAMTDTLGRPFPELMRSLVLDPAGMARSTYEQPLPPARLPEAAAGYRRDGAPVAGKRHVYPEMAAAGLWTTAGDLARFAVAIQRSLRGDEGSLVGKPMAERMVTRFIGDYGLGFGVETREGETYFAHGGADEGFQAYLVAHRGGWGAAVMANSDNGNAL